MIAADVSIIVVTYNRAQTLRQCIDSILMQTFASKEIIVVDDGSTDDTREILESYGGKIQSRFLDHHGAVLTRNAALTIAGGQWIIFLDSDDYYIYPDVIRDFMDRFQEEPGLDVLSSGWRIVDTQGNPLGDVTPWERAPVFDLESCLIWKPTVLSAKMFRHEILDRVSGFDPEYEASMDTDLVFRILLAGGRIGWLKKITYGYRQSPVSIMQNAPRQAHFLVRAMDRVFASPRLPASLRLREAAIRNGTNLWLGWYLWSRGFPDQAATALGAALRYRREESFIQLKNWHGIFHQLSSENGVRQISLEDFLGFALPVLALPADEREEISILFSWWWSVWIPYFSRQESRMPETPIPAGWSARRMVKLAQRCISSGQNPTPPAVVDRLWRDALRAGAISAVEKCEVITLYLTCFVRAVYARNAGIAIASIGKALLHSGSWRAALPWYRFMKSSLNFFYRGRDGAQDTGVNSTAPMVSVILPTHNRARYIGQAIESVLGQDYPRVELIIVDDGSTDNTTTTVQKYLSETVRYLSQEQQGPASARNAGIAISRGTLIAFLDSDDFFLPGKLSAQVPVLETDPGLGAVHSGWREVDEEGNQLEDIEPWTFAPVLNLQTWLLWKPVFLGGMLIRRSWLAKIGTFNTALRQAEDLEMIFRLALAGCRMGWIQKPTVCYRQHPGNITQDSARQADDLMTTIDLFFSEPDLPKKIRAIEPAVKYHTLLWVAFNLWRKGSDNLVGKYLLRAANYTGRNKRQLLYEWHGYLVGQAILHRMDESKIMQLPEILLRIPSNETTPPEILTRDLEWIHQIWWRYQRGLAPSRETILRYSAGMTAREMAKLAQTAMLAAFSPKALFISSRLWDDLLTAGIIEKSARWEVVTLYLTVFSQFCFRRQWGLAAEAIWKSAGSGFHWNALPVWIRFFRAALAYFFMPIANRMNRIDIIKNRIS